MNLEHLKLFIKLAHTQNISQAGQELGLSAAVASNYLNKLEASLSVRLIHRTTRKVSLTQEGIAFLPHAEEVISSVDAAKASIGVGKLSPQGKLRIAAPASFGRMHLIPKLNEFLALYPDLTVDLRLSDTIVDLVEGGFDIAIRIASLKDSTLIAKKLANDQRVLCASPEYIKNYGKPNHPNELTAHRCISLMGSEHWSFKDGDKSLSVKVKPILRTDNGEALRDACKNGIGITANSIWSAYEEIKKGNLIPILEDFPLMSDTAIWAVYPSSRMLALKVRAFIDFYYDLFSDEPYWDK